MSLLAIHHGAIEVKRPPPHAVRGLVRIVRVHRAEKVWISYFDPWILPPKTPDSVWF